MVGSLDEFSVYMCCGKRNNPIILGGVQRSSGDTRGQTLKSCEHNRSRVRKFSNMVNCV